MVAIIEQTSGWSLGEGLKGMMILMTCSVNHWYRALEHRLSAKRQRHQLQYSRL
jgi:hypothetical protein